jgi:hypothetical protein
LVEEARGGGRNRFRVDASPIAPLGFGKNHAREGDLASGFDLAAAQVGIFLSADVSFGNNIAPCATDCALGANCLLDSRHLCRKSLMTVARDLLSLRLTSPWAL